jgi:hypothetical protein
MSTAIKAIVSNREASSLSLRQASAARSYDSIGVHAILGAGTPKASPSEFTVLLKLDKDLLVTTFRAIAGCICIALSYKLGIDEYSVNIHVAK